MKLLCVLESFFSDFLHARFGNFRSFWQFLKIINRMLMIYFRCFQPFALTSSNFVLGKSIMVVIPLRLMPHFIKGIMVVISLDLNICR